MTTKAEDDARATLKTVARITDREPADVLRDLIDGARDRRSAPLVRVTCSPVTVGEGVMLDEPPKQISATMHEAFARLARREEPARVTVPKTEMHVVKLRRRRLVLGR